MISEAQKKVLLFFEKVFNFGLEVYCEIVGQVLATSVYCDGVLLALKLQFILAL